MDKIRELGHVDKGVGSDRVDIENRVVGINVPWGQGVWSNVTKGTQIRCIETDAPHFDMGASFGGAMVAGIPQRNTRLYILSEFAELRSLKASYLPYHNLCSK